MTQASPSVRVHVNIEISPAVLKTVVANAKKKTGANERGRFRVDTADVLAALISHFLVEKDFEAFAEDTANY